MNAATTARPLHRPGSILFAILVLISMMALAATAVIYRMRAQVYAAGIAVSFNQARLTAMGGLEQAMAVLCEANDPAVWWDNPAAFCNQLVSDDGGVRWYFTVYAPVEQSGLASVRYGVIDEGAKINVNTATAETLSRLPGMNAALAEAVIGYRGAAGGIESEFYSRLPCPYQPRNGPLATLEELLLVRGFTAAIVYGQDPNAGGPVRPDAGLSAVLTAATCQRDTNGSSQGKFNINGNLKGLSRTQLPAQTQNFIRGYREDGKVFQSIYDLLDANYVTQKGSQLTSGVGINQVDSLEKSLVAGPISQQLIPASEDTAASQPAGSQPASKATSQSTSVDANSGNSASQSQVSLTPGRLNINTAPVEVLSLLPGVDEGLAQRIVQARSTLSSQQLASRSWIYAQKLVDAQAFKKLIGMITTSSRQYRVRCVGYGIGVQGGRPAGYCVLEAVVDLSSSTPHITYLRDLTRLGMPLAVGP
jgi:DNA uptake protein ComE-like DNA-binding protein